MFEETQIFIGRWLRQSGQIERDRPDAGEPHFLDPDDASSTCTTVSTVSTTSATDYASTATTTTTSTRDDARRPFPNLQDICPPVLEKCTAPDAHFLDICRRRPVCPVCHPGPQHLIAR